ncbi:hypothetical protein EVAR_25449_1 [Eumeta japonica]|uniref:Uncharacterized protein n=1 Tax=Eumeta variegata TaxID=151549 RepID=A0A4C1VKV8_EUMVA|nr:hypothetical protein EVAR_25449_1 [Eumeta japonica]
MFIEFSSRLEYLVQGSEAVITKKCTTDEKARCYTSSMFSAPSSHEYFKRLRLEKQGGHLSEISKTPALRSGARARPPPASALAAAGRSPKLAAVIAYAATSLQK